MATLTVANAPSAGFPVGTKVKAYALKGANTVTPVSGPPPGTSVEEPEVAASGQLVYTGLTEGTYYLLAAEVAGTWRYLHVYPDPISEMGAIATTGLRVKEGTNAKMGVATMAGTTLTVATTAVAATSRIFLQKTGPAPVKGSPLQVISITPGVSFTVESGFSETCSFNWLIVDPA